MKKLLLLLLFLATLAFRHNLMATNGSREKININREWKFKLGDYTGAEAESYNDKDWSNIHLPHNFSIPYFQSAQWYTGYGWYRKYFEIPADWKSKRIFIEFEGAFRVAEIFVNGKQVGTHKGGYTGFSLDITDQVKTGKNVLAVRLNNEWSPRLAPRNGDHNFTGGIYRDAYLVVTDPVHVTWYGTFVTTPEVSKESGVVNIKTEIRNDAKASKGVTVKTNIVDPLGKVVATVLSNQTIGVNSTVEFYQTTQPIKEPKLWHPDHPFMYKAISTILDGKTVLDTYETPFGFRWMEWTADKGFFLNGEHYYFRGANAHQDHAGWASAVTNIALLRDARMIKECGMDFIRGSHYPHDPSFSDACDTLGLLLWQENDFWGSGGNQQETDNWYTGAGAYPMKEEDRPDFEESVKTNLREMIRIHRNHPSIIVWSMCNEPFFTGSGTIELVREFLTELTQLTHELDPTRPVGIGGCQRGEIDKLGDVAGYNGDGARLFMNPGVPNVVTEYGSTIAKRPGKYIPGLGDLQQEKFPWRSGEAIWCAFDYGTRAGDFGLMGMIDYFRLPKNMWYWYRNEYNNITPPEPAEEGIPAKLKLSADKIIISNTNGTDDVFLVVSVLDKEGKQLSNSPDVTLQIVSGPGEFPTGTSIAFGNTSDIYIRDGKAAIEFRSYYGGKTIIKATSTGLQSDLITIETKGTPVYVEGVTPKVADRPYVRYIIKKEENTDSSNINIAYQKPTRASSETNGKDKTEVVKATNSPVFSNFVYQGNDQAYNDYPLNADEFYNPILQGCYPDPAITRKGDDYYLVCSSFAMFPGVPIFHSKDLVNWTPLGGVLDRVSQLDVHNTGISAGVYAPGITYNPNNDTFYMIVTAFAGGLGNIIVKTKDPMKGWSDPIKLNFVGIDPSIFFDEDGKGYIVHNDAPEKGTELYNGHRVIKVWEYDVEKDQIIEGTDKVIVNGGVDLAKKPIWIEAPHIYKKNGKYYLMCAEGGTGGWHSEVIFKSDSPNGPFIPAPSNPILTQRYFAKDRKNKVDWAGHADLVEGPKGKYYGVFLAVRPNEEHRVNTGRETFILPVDWSGEFPVFENGLIPMEPKLKMPNGVENKTGKDGFFPNGNFTYVENFSSEKLDYRWVGLRGPREAFTEKIEEGIQIKPFETNIKELKPTSTLFYRQMHNSFSFAATMNYKPESEKDLAGIVCLQNESSNYVFGITMKGDDYYLLLERNQKKSRWSREVDSEIVASTKIDIENPIRLSVIAKGDVYIFMYSTNGTNLVPLGSVSGDILSTDVAGGFTGCLLGLYATSANDAQPE